MQVNGYLRKDGKVYMILAIGKDFVTVEGGTRIPMHLVGLFEYLDPIREKKETTCKQRQCRLI